MIGFTNHKIRTLGKLISLVLMASVLSACLEPSDADETGSQASAVGGPIASPTLSFTTNTPSVSYNGSTQLSWNSTNTTMCTASGGWSGNKDTDGNEVVGPLTDDTTFTLTCSGSGLNIVRTVIIDVAEPPAPTLSFSANPDSVNFNGTSDLSWSAQNATNCVASGSWGGARNTSGSFRTSALTADSTFSLTCNGAGGSVTGNVTIAVGSPPPQMPTISLSAAPTSVAYNGNTTIAWSTTNATSCTASGAWSGSRATSGSRLFNNLTSDQTYSLSCTGPGGSIQRSVSVSVSAPPAPTLSLSGTPTTVNYNENATLSWSSSNASSCTASGDWNGSKGTSGSESVGPLTTSSSFSLSCTGIGGTQNRTVFVTVNPAPRPTVSLDAAPASVAAGSQATLSWTTTNASSCTASGAWSGGKAISGSEDVGPINANSTYTLQCTGPGGTRSDSVTVTLAPEPTISLSANPQSVTEGGSTTLTWSSSNANSCTAGGAWSGSKSASGSETVGPLNSDSQFSITCSGTGGSTSASTTVNVTQGLRSVNVSWDAPTTRSDGSPLDDLSGFRIYYGTTSNSYTQSVTVNDANSTSHVVSNLTPGTYYFAVTAFDGGNNESDYSTEVSLTIN